MRSLRRERWVIWTMRLALVAVIIGAWLYSTGPGSTSSVILPKIPDVARRFWELLGESDTWSSLGLTLLEVGIALVLAVMLGFVIGFLGSRTRYRADLTKAMVGWAYMVPLVLMLPVFQLWLGFEMKSKIAFAVVNSFLPIALITVTAFREADPKFLTLARAYGATAWQTERLIKFPASLPLLLSGVRTAAALSLISVVVAETLAANEGIGSRLALAGQMLDTQAEFAYIFIILIMVTVVQIAIDLTIGRGAQSQGREI